MGLGLTKGFGTVVEDQFSDSIGFWGSSCGWDLGSGPRSRFRFHGLGLGFGFRTRGGGRGRISNLGFETGTMVGFHDLGPRLVFETHGQVWDSGFSIRVGLEF